MAPESGLRIRIGRIDGSIWGRTQLQDVRLYDREGLFAESPQIEIDWQPLGCLSNRLVIHQLDSELVILHRLPQLIPPREAAAAPARLRHPCRPARRRASCGSASAVTGRARVGSLAGEADIRSRPGAGRASTSAVRDGGDRLRAAARRRARPRPLRPRRPGRTRRPTASPGRCSARGGRSRSTVDGDGSWARWAGTARLDLSGRRTAELALRDGTAASASPGGWRRRHSWNGKKQRLTAPRVQVARQRRRSRDRQLDGRLSLRSAVDRRRRRAASIDLARSRFRDVAIGADLLRPPAMFPNMTGRKVRLRRPARRAVRDRRLRLPADRAARRVRQYRLRGGARRRAAAASREAPVTVPMVATARRVTGVGDVAGGILANLRVQGAAQGDAAAALTGDGLVAHLRQAARAGRASFVDLSDRRLCGRRSPAACALSDPRLRHRRRAHRAAGRAGAGRPGHAGDRDGAGLGAAVRQPVPRLGRRRAAASSRPNLSRGPDRIVHFSNLRHHRAEDRARRHRLPAAATAPSSSRAPAGTAITGRSR